MALLQSQNALLRANLEEIIQDHATFRGFVDESTRHIRRLMIAYSRRLQMLEMQQALKGIDTEPQILIEIQDIRTELEKLQKEIRESELKGTDFLVAKDG